jgi:hypothetical protein
MPIFQQGKVQFIDEINEFKPTLQLAIKEKIIWDSDYRLELVWVTHRYYDINKFVKIKSMDPRLVLPTKNFRNSVIDMIGLAPGAFYNFSDEEMNIELLKNWEIT